MNNRKIIGGLLSLLIIAGALYGLSLYISRGTNASNATTTSQGQVMCAMDVFDCPDGTQVPRTGPNCEFVCPSSSSATSTSSGTTTNGSMITVTGKLTGDISYPENNITILSLLEDSRCPTDVQCVQAGTVRLQARITGGGSSTTTVLALNRPVTFNGKTITLISVTPEKTSGVSIPQAFYTFTFRVE